MFVVPIRALELLRRPVTQKNYTQTNTFAHLPNRKCKQTAAQVRYSLFVPEYSTSTRTNRLLTSDNSAASLRKKICRLNIGNRWAYLEHTASRLLDQTPGSLQGLRAKPRALYSIDTPSLWRIVLLLRCCKSTIQTAVQPLESIMLGLCSCLLYRCLASCDVRLLASYK